MILGMYIDQNRDYLKGELINIVEKAIMDVGEEQELNHFDLILMLSNYKGKALAQVYDANKQLVETIDAAGMIVALFEQHIEKVPALLQGQIKRIVGSRANLNAMVLEGVSKGRILARYLNYELKFYQRQGKKTVEIDLDEFFDNIETENI